MSNKQRLTVYAMWKYQDDLFSGLRVPTGISKDDVIHCIVLTCGEFSCLYTQPEFFRDSISAWCNVWYSNWERILRALNEEYNPIENTDRHEFWSDTRVPDLRTEDSGSFANSSNSQLSESSTSTSEHEDVAYNSYDTKTTDRDYASGSGSSSGSQTNTGSQGNINTLTGKDVNSHTGRVHGNIGVTTNQAMITEEIDLRTKSAFCQIVADHFKQQFCLMIY